MRDPNLSISSLPFVENLYNHFLRDPNSVAPQWREFFLNEDGASPPEPAIGFESLFHQRPSGAFPAHGNLHERIMNIIRAYRFRGHSVAHLDPIEQPRPMPPELDPAYYHFTEGELNQPFAFEMLAPTPVPVREILRRLQATYCRTIGAEFMHIDDVKIRRWLQDRMESAENHAQLTRQDQLRILTRLTDAVIFEEFVRRKFVGAKTFSLEGSESLIPLLDVAIERAAEQGVAEIVFGMAHRGRLNVLANIMGKHPKQIFREFADLEPEQYRGSGDVKYHLGHSSDWKTASGKTVHLSLSYNPSHLEFVNPIVLGRTRGIQDRTNDGERRHTMALLIHGDAAFAGQGIVQETLNFSCLRGYTVGGTLHVVVDNQIGFTTSAEESRSTRYSTDVAKMLQIPIFHVNGEDPEGVTQVIQLCMDFRHTFQRDVVIDIHAYRRLGHNESDEPSFTQPLLYRAIEHRKPVREGYLDYLLALGGVTRAEADEIAAIRREHLEAALSESRRTNYRKLQQDGNGIWANYIGGPEQNVPEVSTGVPKARLSELLEKQTELPPGFHPHPKLTRFLDARKAMAKGKHPLDWSAAEALSLATLATEGFRIRLSGEDSGRGTFSHRHAALHDFENNSVYVPLQHLDPNQAPVEIINSPLSEAGVLGYELGYSMEWPNGLTIWEAQFGDFINVAQVIVDQFLLSAEKKWHRYSGLVLLLPHGFEGQGPEHSSARLERFLALAAEDNIQVVYPTTPAQLFHVLRRQMLRNWRKPLVVMTPKSLLRHPQVVSSLDDLASGSFQRIIPDALQIQSAERVLLCSGKIYYDLAKRRQELNRNDVAILRLEQLYPMADELLEKALAPYADTPVFWVQEEPENMGAWRYLQARFGQHFSSYIGRPASASPATGSASSHKQEQEQIVANAFNQGPMPPVRTGLKPAQEHADRTENPRSRRIRD